MLVGLGLIGIAGVASAHPNNGKAKAYRPHLNGAARLTIEDEDGIRTVTATDDNGVLVSPPGTAMGNCEKKKTLSLAVTGTDFPVTLRVTDCQGGDSEDEPDAWDEYIVEGFGNDESRILVIDDYGGGSPSGDGSGDDDSSKGDDDDCCICDDCSHDPDPRAAGLLLTGFLTATVLLVSRRRGRPGQRAGVDRE